MASLQIQNVSKNIGHVEILHGATLHIEDGQFVALVGPSGCGKSTLLRLIAGLEDLSAGEISIGGERMNGVPAKLRNIAMVFQSYALYPHMTVAENMGFALKMTGLPKAESRKPKAESRNSRKSHASCANSQSRASVGPCPQATFRGQRQRVAMGRAIVRNPKFFLFDEPLSNMDAKLRIQMRAEIKELHQRLKVTTVYVTHDQIEAMTMADVVVVMREGAIEQVGAPLYLYDNPRNLFVAGFIGSPSMNFIKGEIDLKAPVLNVGEGVTLPLDNIPSGVSGPVICGIRPEHFVIDNEHGVQAEIVVVEPTGSETQMHVKIGGQVAVAVFKDRVLARPGDVIRLLPAPGKAMLFNPKEELRLA